MKYIKMFEQFIVEDAVSAGADSKVFIDDMTLDSGKKIRATEILGAVIDAETEKELEDYFYNTFGQGSFTEGEMSTLIKHWNDHQAELAAAEREEEEDENKEDVGDGDLDLDL